MVQSNALLEVQFCTFHNNYVGKFAAHCGNPTCYYVNCNCQLADGATTAGYGGAIYIAGKHETGQAPLAPTDPALSNGGSVRAEDTHFSSNTASLLGDNIDARPGSRYSSACSGQYSLMTSDQCESCTFKNCKAATQSQPRCTGPTLCTADAWQRGLCGKATALASTSFGLYEIGNSRWGVDFFQEVSRYTAATDVWEKNIHAAPTERSGYGVAAVGNLFYSIGGTNGNHTHNYRLNERYNANFAPSPPTSAPTSSPAMVETRRVTLIVAGGVAAGVFVLGLLAVAVLALKRKRKRGYLHDLLIEDGDGCRSDQLLPEWAHPLCKQWAVDMPDPAFKTIEADLRTFQLWLRPHLLLKGELLEYFVAGQKGTSAQQALPYVSHLVYSEVLGTHKFVLFDYICRPQDDSVQLGTLDEAIHVGEQLEKRGKRYVAFHCVLQPTFEMFADAALKWCAWCVRGVHVSGHVSTRRGLFWCGAGGAAERSDDGAFCNVVWSARDAGAPLELVFINAACSAALACKLVAQDPAAAGDNLVAISWATEATEEACWQFMLEFYMSLDKTRCPLQAYARSVAALCSTHGSQCLTDPRGCSGGIGVPCLVSKGELRLGTEAVGLESLLLFASNVDLPVHSDDCLNLLPKPLPTLVLFLSLSALFNPSGELASFL